MIGLFTDALRHVVVAEICKCAAASGGKMRYWDMASKVQIQKGAEMALEKSEGVTALALVGSGGGAMAAAAPGGSFLPGLKLVYPIECGRDIPAKFAYHFGLSDGEGFEALLGKYALVALASRNAARRLVDNGGEKSYDRAYAAWKGQGSTVEKFATMEKAAGADPEIKVGASYLVAVLTDEGATIAQCDAFGALGSYIGKVLYQANLEAGLRADIKITDHSPNLTDNKAGDKQYLAAKKFRQFAVEPLTDAQREAINVAIAAAEDEILGWVRR